MNSFTKERKLFNPCPKHTFFVHKSLDTTGSPSGTVIHWEKNVKLNCPVAKSKRKIVFFKLNVHELILPVFRSLVPKDFQEMESPGKTPHTNTQRSFSFLHSWSHYNTFAHAGESRKAAEIGGKINRGFTRQKTAFCSG